jgi:Zn finger protein HypA/HybF involved in hydrogenase expression
MAHTAICENADCEKGEWELTKPPSSYAGGGVSCPTCGTTRTTVDVDGQEAASEGRQQTADPAESRAPARAQEATEAPAAAGSGPSMSAGEGLIAALDNEAPAEVQKKGVESVGRGIIRFAKAAISYGEKKDEMRNARAQNADVQRVEDKPDCEVCGTTISEIPVADDRFQCENCGAEYEVMGGR